IEEIHALNRELIAAGARKFACGLSPAGNAKSLRAQPDGKVLVTDGPHTETKEHMGGFWILEAADLDEALAWARKGAVACRASGEVRDILFNPEPKGATEWSGRCALGPCCRARCPRRGSLKDGLHQLYEAAPISLLAIRREARTA